MQTDEELPGPTEAGEGAMGEENPESFRDEFRVSIKHIDYYTTKPTPEIDICYSPFTGQEVRVAPVVRVFGSTPAGQTVCLHFHKVLPYLYVRYNSSPNASVVDQNTYLRKLAHSIDAALQLSHQPNRSGNGGETSSLKAKSVHLCTLVRALPFYGYHTKEEFFAKIYVYDPKDLSRVANVLLSGAVLGQTFQPFEAHVPYLLKFKTDYNLHGMEYVRLSKVLLREPLPESPSPHRKRKQWGSVPQEEMGGAYPLWTQDNVPGKWIDGGGRSKEAHCDLEADAFGEHILNPSSIPAVSLQEADENMQMVPSLAPIWAEERQRNEKLNKSFPPRTSLSPKRREEHLHHLRFGQKYSDALRAAIKEKAKERRELVLDSQDFQDEDLPLMMTQAANEITRLEDESERMMSQSGVAALHEEGQHLSQKSLLTTQEADRVLLDTLHWMQENKDKTDLDREIWDGKGEEEEQSEMMEYMTLSQRECEDIICSTAQAAELNETSMQSPSRGNGTSLDTPSKHEQDSGDYEPLNLMLDLEEEESEFESVERSAPSDPESHSGETLNDVPREEVGASRFTKEEGNDLTLFRPITSAPSYADVKSSMRPLELADVVYSEPFFSNQRDVPSRPSCFAGMEFKLKSKSAMDLEGFSCNSKCGSKFLQIGTGIASRNDLMAGGSCVHLLASKRAPPSLKEVNAWLSRRGVPLHEKRTSSSVRDFKMDPNTGQFMEESEGCMLSVDVLAQSGSFVVTPSNHLDARPASPKYDEQVPLHVLETSYNSKILSEENAESSSPWEQDKGCRVAFLPSPQIKLESGGAGNSSEGRIDPATLRKGISQITPPSPLKEGKENTPSSQAGYKYQSLEQFRSTKDSPTVLSIEVFVETRGMFLPDPKHDPVRAIALVYEEQRLRRTSQRNVLELLVCGESFPKGLLSSMKRKHALSESSTHFMFVDEIELIRSAAERIVQADPDVIMGYEIQSESLGYLKDRLALLQPSESFLRLISRSPSIPSHSEMLSDEYGQLHASGLHSAGRILLNLWRVLRSELKLSIYTFHNCVHALTRRRVPHFASAQLTAWFKTDSSKFRCLEHLVQKAVLNLEMIECLDLVSRTCELAKVYGIDFFSVLTRGSQYRVESLLLRLAHTQNYILISPSKSQVANQSAMECLPLVMEPESRFYTSPVVVLDFQSLYPSIVMAYNLCYSTLVGHAETSGVASSLGVLAKYKSSLLDGGIPLEELVFSPNGSLFASKNVRKGVLPRMLQEILDTRQMLKKSMKDLPANQKSLYRLMNSRQFALKLLANVTYGYTAAGFSGRMPCAELADAIVQFGRLTMENAIKLVNGNQRWQAKVVYGDTDSIFVHLPGRSREDAFRIGQEIAKEVTSVNPSPVFLKFEKVYHPCVLVTKKRYVGYAFETFEQKKPIFDAKGIETIRRDSCPAVSKLLERSLRILFESADLSLVKRYLLKQWEKIFKNRVSVQDFVFAKEVRLGTYSAKASVVPPAAIVAAKAMALDPRAEPKFAERVPYVVVRGEPGARLVDMVVSPGTLVANERGLRLHETYYISKQIIPALERCFSLLGADVRAWFAQMPKPNRWQPAKRPISALGLSGYSNDSIGYRQEVKSRLTIDHFYLSKHCAVCDEMTATDQTICDKCRCSPQATALALQARSASLERNLKMLNSLCSHCGGADLQGTIVCSSLDCGLYFLRQKNAQQHSASVILMLSSDGFIL